MPLVFLSCDIKKTLEFGQSPLSPNLCIFCRHIWYSKYTISFPLHKIIDMLVANDDIGYFHSSEMKNFAWYFIC